MRIERTHNMAVVKEIMSHPLIFPHIHEDGINEVNPLCHEGLYWMLVSDDKPAGVFLVHAHNTSCYEMHTCLLPRVWGVQSKEAVKLLGNYLFNELVCKKIITNVPAYNKRALRFAKANGMTVEGINRASYLHNGVLEDQTMLGITKEEWIKCQQQSQ